MKRGKRRWLLFIFFACTLVASVTALVLLDNPSSTVEGILGFIAVVSFIVLVLSGLTSLGFEFEFQLGGSQDNELTRVHQELMRQRARPLYWTFPVRPAPLAGGTQPGRRHKGYNRATHPSSTEKRGGS